MRTLCSVVLVLAVVACAKKDDAADTAGASVAATPAPAPASPSARFAGNWSGMGYGEKDTKGQPFMVMADSSGNSTAVMGKDTVRYHTISTTDTSFVLESAPYMNPDMKTEVVDHVEGHMVGDSLVGTNEMRPTKGGTAMKGRWTAHRKP